MLLEGGASFVRSEEGVSPVDTAIYNAKDDDHEDAIVDRTVHRTAALYRVRLVERPVASAIQARPGHLEPDAQPDMAGDQVQCVAHQGEATRRAARAVRASRRAFCFSAQAHKKQTHSGRATGHPAAPFGTPRAVRAAMAT